MKIEAFILSFNESLMVRYTLNHYASFCSKITVIDNESNDDTLKIIKEEYPNVIIKTFCTDGQYKEDVLTESRNNCWKNSDADYVIVCDMDEFLYDENLEQKLSLLEEHKPALCSIIGYEMFSDTFPENYNLSIFDQVKNGLRNSIFDKIILFSPKKVKEINYDVGAHICRPKFYNKKERDFLIEFKLLHYKYLSKKYLAKKHLLYGNRRSKMSILKKWGFQYQKGNSYTKKKFKKASRYLVKIIP